MLRQIWNLHIHVEVKIVTSDNYQLTLTVIRKKAVYIIKANVQSVAHQFSHRHTTVHAAGQLAWPWRAASDKTMQQSSAASGHQRWVWACGTRHAPAWCFRLYLQLDSGRYYSTATGLGKWSAVSLTFDAVLYAVKIVGSFYKVQNEHIKCCVRWCWKCLTWKWRTRN